MACSRPSCAFLRFGSSFPSDAFLRASFSFVPTLIAHAAAMCTALPSRAQRDPSPTFLLSFSPFFHALRAFSARIPFLCAFFSRAFAARPTTAPCASSSRHCGAAACADPAACAPLPHFRPPFSIFLRFRNVFSLTAPRALHRSLAAPSRHVTAPRTHTTHTRRGAPRTRKKPAAAGRFRPCPPPPFFSSTTRLLQSDRAARLVFFSPPLRLALALAAAHPWLSIHPTKAARRGTSAGVSGARAAGILLRCTVDAVSQRQCSS